MFLFPFPHFPSGILNGPTGAPPLNRPRGILDDLVHLQHVRPGERFFGSVPDARGLSQTHPSAPN